MHVDPYDQAFERIRAEYLEMPGMRLTPEQVQRLSGVEAATCRQVLEDLVRAKFLHLRSDGKYARVSDGRPAGPPAAVARRASVAVTSLALKSS